MNETATESTPQTIALQNLPALRQPLADGLFAGLTTKSDGTHCAVVLLPARPAEKLDWKSAMKWADKSGGELPTRPVAALLFANLRAEFEEAWHWTSEPCDFDGSFAWYQDLVGGGYQGSLHKSYAGRARAVRLIPLVL